MRDSPTRRDSDGNFEEADGALCPAAMGAGDYMIMASVTGCGSNSAALLPRNGREEDAEHESQAPKTRRCRSNCALAQPRRPPHGGSGEVLDGNRASPPGASIDVGGKGCDARQ